MMNIYISKSKLVKKSSLEEIKNFLHAVQLKKTLSITYYSPEVHGSYKSVHRFVNATTDLVVCLVTEETTKLSEIIFTLGKGGYLEVEEAKKLEIPVLYVVFTRSTKFKFLKAEDVTEESINPSDWMFFSTMCAPKSKVLTTTEVASFLLAEDSNIKYSELPANQTIGLILKRHW